MAVNCISYAKLIQANSRYSFDLSIDSTTERYLQKMSNIAIYSRDGQNCVKGFFYYPFLSSIHEKANCIVIFWTGRPHTLGSCHFRDVWATCRPHKSGGVPLSALLKVTTSKLAGLEESCWFNPEQCNFFGRPANFRLLEHLACL